MEYHNDTIILGKLSADVLDATLNIAHGEFTRDMNFRNIVYYGNEFLEMLSTFARGTKDGRCILSGAVVNPPTGQRGTPRVAVNMLKNYLMMVDFDQGDTPEQVVEKASKHGLFCVVWTTHSHLKPMSSVPEKTLLEWLAKSKNIRTTEPTEQQVIDYFRELIKTREEFLQGAKLLGREMIPGGRAYKLQHVPMPRCRALFILAEPFDFATRKGSQQDAINEWKSLYLGLCENTLETTAYDPKCLDPSRLMYLPRIADDADKGQHKIIVHPGKLLDLKDIVPIDRNKRAVAQVAPGLAALQKVAGAAANTTPGAVKTAGLPEFLKKYADLFEAAEWLEAHDPDKQCPFADRHTPSANGIDTGFKAWNASDSEHGSFGMQCSHSCGADPLRGQGPNGKQDRALYLDALCQKFGITSANDLVDENWCPGAEARAEEERAAGAAVLQQHAEVTETVSGDAADKAQEERIRSFTPDTKPEDVTGMLRLFAARADPADDTRVRALVKLLAVKIDDSKTELMKTVLRLRVSAANEVATAQRAANVAAGIQVVEVQHGLPKGIEDIEAIWKDWHFRDQSDWCRRWFAYENNKDPRVFTRPEGGCLRVEDAGGRAVVAEMTHGMWAAEMNRLITFNQVIHEPDGTRTERGVAPFKELITDMANGAERPYPLLDRIVRVPVFGPDGTLRTERGYDAGLDVFIDPSCHVDRVAVKPTPDEVARAKAWLVEAGRDFPFSDIFADTEVETLPVKGDGPADDRGYIDPNWDRGMSSRVNFIGAVLQPFVRNMITSPCPAYGIIKPIAGSGAGYMADAISIIAEGQKASAQPMSEQNEEFRKSITATLRSGAGIIFIDNISRKVDSGELAAALTAGSWRDRVIMSSNVVDIPVKALWLFAGNRTRFKDEIARRMVPIKINPAVESATQDRPPNFYKHFPYQPWLMENRPIMVWSALTLISHWIAQGKPPGPAVMHSFDAYADIISGILMCAGFPEGLFLSNSAAYLAAAQTERNTAKQFLQVCYDKFGDASMTGKEMLASVTDAFGNLVTDIPVDSKHENQRGKELKIFLEECAIGKTFTLQTKTAEAAPQAEISVTLTVRQQQAPVKYGFSEVKQSK